MKLPATVTIISDMRILLFLIGVSGVLLFSGCASGPSGADQAQSGPSPKEQRQDARQREEFAKTLPPPR